MILSAVIPLRLGSFRSSEGRRRRSDASSAGRFGRRMGMRPRWSPWRSAGSGVGPLKRDRLAATVTLGISHEMEWPATMRLLGRNQVNGCHCGHHSCALAGWRSASCWRSPPVPRSERYRTPAATIGTPASARARRPHPLRSKSAATPVSCCCSDCAVCCGAVPARSGAVLRQAVRAWCCPKSNSAVLAHNPEVAGSNPAPATSKSRSEA
jgi:hypothetical protein